MRSWVALVALLMVGCTGSTTTVAHVPSPSPSSSPSSIPTPVITVLPSASPTVADLPVATVPFSCRLPVMVETTGSGPVSFQGGFISFPSGTFKADPRGAIATLPGSMTLQTAQAPVLTGATDAGLPFYDATADRWVPAGAAQASPDGSSYAYATIGDSIAAGATIHIVTVASGADHTLNVSIPTVGAPAGVQVMDFDGTNVYFVVSQFENYPTGVWRLSTTSGGVKAMAQVSNIMAVRSGYAWAGAVDPHDPTPPTVPASRRLFDTIVRVDLASGARTSWLYKLGQSVVLDAVDSQGRAVVSVSSAPEFSSYGGEIARVAEPVSGGENNGEVVYAGGLWFDQPQPDGDRIWFGNDRGIYLYTPGAGMQKVFSFTPASGQSLFPAGLCV